MRFLTPTRCKVRNTEIHSPPRKQVHIWYLQDVSGEPEGIVLQACHKTLREPRLRFELVHIDVPYYLLAETTFL